MWVAAARVSAVNKPLDSLAAAVEERIFLNMPERKELFFQWAPLLLIWSCLMLLPASRWSEAPIVVMALLGLALVFRFGWRALLKEGKYRNFTLLFLLFWLPILLSLPGAVNPGKALTVLAAYPRLYLAGLFIIKTLSSGLARQRFLRLCAWGLLFWVGDSLLQYFHGVDLFGFTYTEGVRLSGIFGRYPIKLGWCMALFSPFLLVYARRNWHPVVQLGAFAGVLAVVLMSFSRGGWIAFSVILGGYGIYALKEQGRRLLPAAAVVLIISIIGIIGLYHSSPGFSSTVQRTSLVFTGDPEAINQAITWRAPIWRTAISMFSANPVNGVGARGFRYAYAEYSAPEDLYVEPNSGFLGATHAHQLVLDLASETGFIGIAGWLAAMGLLVGIWRKAVASDKQAMLPYALALFAAFFPLNTHFAIYSSVWSLVLFWLMALFCAHSSREVG